jgi:capsular exopolysaccharide synthesis family protein
MEYEEAKREIDLLEYWNIVIKRKWLIVAVTGALVFLAALFSFLATPQYSSTAILYIEEETSRMLSIDQEFGYQSPVVRDLRYFNTQLRLLKSKSLAERVARKMDLLNREDFVSQSTKFNPIRLVKDIVTLKWLSFGKKKGGEEGVSNPYSGPAGKIQRKIEVEPIRDTKLVEVSYVSPSALLSADIVNNLAEEFISFSVEKRSETTQQASDFLAEQIVELRSEIANLDRELQRYGQDKGFLLSDSENTLVRELQDLSNAWMQAKIDRVSAESAYQELRNLEAGTIPQYVNNPTVQGLITEYSRVKSEYERNSRLYKEDYPEMIQLKGELEGLEEQIGNAVGSAQQQWREAQRRERSLFNELERKKGEVGQMQSDAILYNSKQIEVESKRNLLNSLESQRSKTQVSARLGGLKSSNIAIIDPGEVSFNAVSPNKRQNIIFALLIGLLGGVGLCFLLEHLDNTVKGPENLEKISGIPSLGMIPYLSPDGVGDKKQYSRYGRSSGGPALNDKGQLEIREIELINHLYPSFYISEDYRTLRTSIMLSHADSPPRTLLFTSVIPKEGKTTTVSNMAVSFAQLGKRVLIVDADLRKPRIHRIFKVGNTPGLSGYLTGRAGFEQTIQSPTIENIFVIPSGPIPPNPAELLNSKKMRELMAQVKEEFDIVLVDAPPALAVVDPVILSELVDGLIVVIKTGKTMIKPLMLGIDKLQQGNGKIIGVIFNEFQVKTEPKGLTGYSGYYHTEYYGSSEEEQSDKRK